jgi:hypothetical protein
MSDVERLTEEHLGYTESNADDSGVKIDQIDTEDINLKDMGH